MSSFWTKLKQRFTGNHCIHEWGEYQLCVKCKQCFGPPTQNKRAGNCTCGAPAYDLGYGGGIRRICQRSDHMVWDCPYQ